jgi:multidrug efflux system membrane fusion protein
LAILVAVLAVGGLVATWWVNHTGANADQQEAGGGRRRFREMSGPLPVVVQPAVKGDINLYLDGLGTVTPLATVTVRTQVSGQLVKIAFDEGQWVKQGDLLAIVDPRPYQVALEQAQGQLEQAQAQLKEAQADLARYQTLASQDSIAKQQVDAQAALVSQDQGLVQTDQAAIDSAKLNLTYCHVTAPVSGRVGLRQVDIGNYVTPGDSNGLVVLTEIKPITVIFTLPEDNMDQVAARLHSGATLPVDAYDRTESRRIATGSLTAIDNEVDPTTGTFKLRATFANDDESLFPSEFVNARMLLDVDRGAVVIPTSGVERGEQGTYVYLVQPDSTVTARTVTLGPTEGERVAVISGLSVGDRVVVDGADRLKEGMDVIVQAPTGSDAAPTADKPRRRHHRPADGSAAGASDQAGGASDQAGGASAKPAPSGGNSN